MSKQVGTFGYDAPSDMTGKLGRDYQRMRTDPHDKDAAIDFFKTADCLLDWWAPDKKTTGDRALHRKKIIASNPDLKRTRRIANGSKHFIVLSDPDGNVASKNEFGGFSPAAFSANAFSPSAFKFDGLHIEGSAGTFEPALALAERVLDYWRQRVSSSI